ncbi:MAG: DinB family protein [Planctomycetota bacterium]
MRKADAANLRDHVLWLLDCKSAHVGFDAALADFPVKLRGAQHERIPYSAWQLLEHLRIAQRDMLDYCRDPEHVSPAWPQEYWPTEAAPPSAAAWARSARAFRADGKAMRSLVSQRAGRLMQPMPHTPGVTLLTEALLIADHNAYHIGQLVLLRRALGAW